MWKGKNSWSPLYIPSCSPWIFLKPSFKLLLNTSSSKIIHILNTFSIEGKGLIMEALRRLGSESPVVIFSKSNCCISHSIYMLISSFGANPVVYNLDQHPKGREIENALLGSLGCNPSVPAVFIGKLFVGGSNEVMSLNIQGKLKPLLIKANAIWI